MDIPITVEGGNVDHVWNSAWAIKRPDGKFVFIDGPTVNSEQEALQHYVGQVELSKRVSEPKRVSH